MTAGRSRALYFSKYASVFCQIHHREKPIDRVNANEKEVCVNAVCECGPQDSCVRSCVWWPMLLVLALRR